jgi:3-hydroxybutyryl-CoA dehydratase
MSVTRQALEPGQRVSLSRRITEHDIDVFADLSLDRNPIHFDDSFAARTFFGKRIAHGMISAALVSGALTELMGNGNVWLSLSLEFRKPVYVGEEVTITEIQRRNIATIDVQILNSNSEQVITGTAKSMRASHRV